VRRREALAALWAAARAARGERRTSSVLIEVRSGRVISEQAGRMAGPPGSTMKPLVLATLIEAGKLRAEDRWPCPGELRIAGRALACSHPPLSAPVDARTAIAYSCNCFVAHMAERFEPGELERALRRFGLDEQRPADTRLLALGEDGVLATASALAAAYRRLALGAPELVLAGMEDAVEYGTAQRARVQWWKVAGKTGSVVSAEGAHLAWFAGFAPSRVPKVAVAVMVQGRSGGSDAAPVARQMLEACVKETP